jgi:hypothetical protein
MKLASIVTPTLHGKKNLCCNLQIDVEFYTIVPMLCQPPARTRKSARAPGHLVPWCHTSIVALLLCSTLSESVAPTSCLPIASGRVHASKCSTSLHHSLLHSPPLVNAVTLAPCVHGCRCGTVVSCVRKSTGEMVATRSSAGLCRRG